MSRVSSIPTGSVTVTEKSAERDNYQEAKIEDESTKETMTSATRAKTPIDKFKSYIEPQRRASKAKVDFKETALYKRLSKDDYAEARKVLLRNTPLEAIRKQSILMLGMSSTAEGRKNSIKRRIFQNSEILNERSEY